MFIPRPVLGQVPNFAVASDKSGCDGAEILREILICRIGRNFPESGPKCSDITAPPPPTHGTMYAFAHEGNYGPLQMIQVLSEITP